MPKAALFVEDWAHEAIIGALVNRVAGEFNLALDVEFRSSRKGFSKVHQELKQYIRDISRGLETHPDLLIVCTDSNCKGYVDRRKELESALENYDGPVIYAIPDPHIERWLLLDAAAFKAVLGTGCAQPPKKCERNLYKQKLIEAVVGANIRPLFGGIEHAEALVKEMDFNSVSQADESFARFIKALRNKLKELFLS